MANDKPQEKKNIIDQAVDATKSGLSQAREVIHDATKSKEERDAEKPLDEKLKDKVPDNAEDAGQKIGAKVDEGLDFAKKKVDELKEQSK